jgi:hypothetical protein
MNLRNALIKTGFRTKVPLTGKEGDENSLIIILLQQQEDRKDIERNLVQMMAFVRTCIQLWPMLKST